MQYAQVEKQEINGNAEDEEMKMCIQVNGQEESKSPRS